MPKAPDTPYDLSRHDPKLRSLLDQRDALLKSLSGPIRQAQQALSRFNESGSSTAGSSAAPDKDLPALTVAFTDKLSILMEIDRELDDIHKEKSDPRRTFELANLVAHQDSLTSLKQSSLSDSELRQFAPEAYPNLEEIDDRIVDEKRARKELKRSLSSWWERVIVDGIRGIFGRSTKADDLEATEQELEKLERKRNRVEEEVRQVAVAKLSKLIKQANIATQQKQNELASTEKHLEKKAAHARRKREEALDGVRKTGDRLRRSLKGFCDMAVEQVNSTTSEVVAYLKSLPPAAILPWTASEWDAWPPVDEKGKAVIKPFLSEYIRIGEIREIWADKLSKFFEGDVLQTLKSKAISVSIPIVVPFIGQNRTLIISCDRRTCDDGLALVQSMILRVAAMLGRQAKFTLLDPAGHGQAFPTQRFLQARSNADDVNTDLKGVQQDIRQINQNVLSGEGGLHELEVRRLASEQFDLLVAAGFPKGFDRRAVETLYNLGAVGPRAGRYLILHHDRSEPLPREHPIENVKNALTLDPLKTYVPPVDFRFQLDQVPTAQQQQAILKRIEEAGKIDHSLDWDDIIRPETPADWWAGSSEMEIATPIGVRGGTDKAAFWLGQKSGGEVCAHGVLGGMTGSGKSTLYHDIILGLASRYSSDELRMYLIDLKRGVEFQPYKDLPHAMVVSLNSPAELTLSILQEMEAEMAIRNDIFKADGVSSFSEYRRQGKKMPRILLLIDEYQMLFSTDDKLSEAASAVLLRIAQQGRSAGLHMFLGSQKFGAPGMLNQSAIFANFHLRVAMKLQRETTDGLTEFGPFGKRLIREISMSGKFVLNDSGQDEKTVAGQAAYLKPERRDELIQQIWSRAGSLGTRPEVFDGQAPTSIFNNHALNSIIAQRDTLNPKLLESLARKEEGAALGFGQPRWVANDRPLGLWLGRRFNVHGHTMVMLIRNVQQNLLIVGSPATARAGMLAGVMVSAATLYRPADLVVDVLHAGGDDDDPSLITCTLLVENLLRKSGHNVTFSREVAQADSLLVQYDSELATRKEKSIRDAPSRLLILLEPDRMPALRRSADVGRPTPNQERFRRLITEGSQNGLHVILAISALSLINMILDKRRDLSSFSHRVGLQMSQNDSFDLFGNYKATTLQADGANVPCALYLNTELNDPIRFKPYSVPDSEAIDRYVRKLTQSVANHVSGG